MIVAVAILFLAIVVVFVALVVVFFVAVVVVIVAVALARRVDTTGVNDRSHRKIVFEDPKQYVFDD